MEQLNNLDVIFLIIVGISALVGIARGMTKEVLSLVGWVLAAAALFYLVPLVNPFMKDYVSSDLLASVVSGLAILLVFCIIWILTVDKLSALIRSSKLSALDRMFGFIFGTARGVLIVILVSLLLSNLMPDDSKKGIFEKSLLFAKANECIEPLKEMIPQSWIDEFKAQSERFGIHKKQETEEGEEKSEDADKNKETEDKSETKDKSEQNKKGLRETLNNIDNNLDVLQKNGEALFKQLAQPKTKDKDDKDNSGSGDDLMSDLDKLLDVLEDKMVTEEKKDGKRK